MRRSFIRVGLSSSLVAAGIVVASGNLPFAWGQQQPGAAGGAAAPAGAAPAGAVPPGQGPYDEMPIPALLDERGKQKQELSAVRQRINQIKTTVNQVITGEQALTAQQRVMDGYYTRYLFPRLTLLDNIETPDKFNELYKVRTDFIRDVRRTQRPDVHDYLIRTGLTQMTAIVKGNYHPAARFNAMLVITELNLREPVRTGTPSPPEPLMEALPPMVEALEDANQLDSVRVAAMLGVLRHVQWDARQRDTRQPANRRIDAAVRARIEQYAVKLIGAKDPPAGRTRDGHAWMQRRAIDVMGAMGTLGTNVTVAQSVEDMVGDSAMPISLRCTAAEALGQINLPAESNLDPVAAAQKLGELAVFACQREVKHWEDEKAYILEKRKMGGGASGLGGGPGGMMPGMGMGGGAPDLMPGGAGGGAPGLGGGAPGLEGPGDGGAMPGLMPGMGGGAGGMMPGMGGAMGGPTTDKDAYRLEVAQRRTRAQMQCVKVGLAGVKDKTTGIIGLVKDDAQKKAIQKLADEVAAVRDLSESETLTRYDKFMDELKNRIKTLEAATQTVVALNKPAAPAADVPGADVPGGDVPGAAPPGPAAPGPAAPGPAAPGPAAPGGAPAPAGAAPNSGAPAGKPGAAN